MHVRRALSRRLSDESWGVTSIEYALIAALIAMAIIGVLPRFGSAVGNLYTYVAEAFTNVTP